jgi:hypothetical protein
MSIVHPSIHPTPRGRGEPSQPRGESSMRHGALPLEPGLVCVRSFASRNGHRGETSPKAPTGRRYTTRGVSMGSQGGTGALAPPVCGSGGCSGRCCRIPWKWRGGCRRKTAPKMPGGHWHRPPSTARRPLPLRPDRGFCRLAPSRSPSPGSGCSSKGRLTRARKYPRRPSWQRENPLMVRGGSGERARIIHLRRWFH